MSGFFGILRFDGKPVSREFLDVIAEKMKFRAPDGQNIWSHDNLGSSFALMRTGPAKQASQQPVTWCNRFWLWGDIRLDARKELCAQAGEERAIGEATITDEELLLRAWAKWGANSLEHVIGDFSFALWDAKDRVLWCVRDFIGARPFFYAQTNGVFCFSNTLQILRSVPEISGELDEGFIADFLLDGWTLDPSSTVYRNIKRLQPGHLLRFTAHSNVSVKRFRKLSIEAPLQLRRAEEYVERYRDLLNTVVRDRLPSAATSLHLSGGLDSGAICAVAGQIAAASGQKPTLKAFTDSWNPFLEDSDPAFAKITAEHLGLAHSIFEEQTLQLFEYAVTHEEVPPEPDDQFFFTRDQRSFQAMAAHSNVALGGDGGDEVLTGQSWPYLVGLWRQQQWKSLVQDFAGYLWTHKSVPPLGAGIRTKIRRLMKREDLSDAYPHWINQDFATRLDLNQRWLELNTPSQTNEHPLHAAAYDLLHSGICGRGSEVEDAGWNRVNLETRSSLLDLRMLAFLLRLPPVPWCMKKELCRRAMQDLLPPPILSRPKTPLRRNPVEVAGEIQQEWLACLPKSRAGRIESFVNWEKWCETLCVSKGSFNSAILRPAGLFFWLKAVET